MSYYYSKITDYSFEEAIEKVTEELKSEGFGVLTEINVHDVLKEKLDVDFRKYKILGACNPNFAHKALTTENKIGTMLPCNVIIQETDGKKIEITAVNPAASMAAVENDQLPAIAGEVGDKLQQVIDRI